MEKPKLSCRGGACVADGIELCRISALKKIETYPQPQHFVASHVGSFSIAKYRENVLLNY